MPERNVDVTHLFNMRKVVKLLWTNLFLGQHLKGQMSYRSRDTAPFLNTDLLMFNFSTFSGLIGGGGDKQCILYLPDCRKDIFTDPTVLSIQYVDQTISFPFYLFAVRQ